MISFDCIQCGKALIVPNAKSGGAVRCPSCSAELAVPAPPKPSKIVPRVRLLVLLAIALVAGGWAYSWSYEKYRRPVLMRERLFAHLQVLSPQWRGPSWEKCDPRTGEYKVTVFYLRDVGQYAFEAYSAFDETSVIVNPSRDGAQWLARATFSHGAPMSYHYAGDDGDERRDLNILAQNLADALRDAVR
jgi:DNA-directed RNA polymerase subunit RPC12/RpoP